MKTRLAAIGAIIASTILLVGVVFWWLTMRTETLESAGVKFSYPRNYSDQTFLAEQSVVAFLKSEKPIGNITLAFEKGVGTGANIAKMNILDNLESNLAKSLPGKYKEYKKDIQARIKCDGRDATRHSFTYTGSDDTTKIHVVLVILPIQQDAYYLTVESIDKTGADTDADTIINSLKL